MRWALSVLGGPAGPSAEVELVKDRPWSRVWRIATASGPVWLKACPPLTRHEVLLLDALAGWEVPHALVPLAVEPDEGWILLPDGGPTVREVPLPPAAAARRWAEVLVGYARTQRATEAHADDLVALGVPDLRPATLPAVFAGLADRWAPEALAVLSRVSEEAAELTELGPSPTLQHDDLHDGNVFQRGGRPFDWGDACVGHPFASLLVALDVPELREGRAAAREAYLSAWPELADADAARAVELGVRLGRVTRAHSWERALEAWPDPPEDYRGAPGWWLRTLLD